MAAKSRTKGAAGEREFINLLQRELNSRGNTLELRRDLRQYQDSGLSDVAGDLEEFAVEIKRYKTVTQGMVDAWWTEAMVQAFDAKRMPVLAYRGDKQRWRVRFPMTLLYKPVQERTYNPSVEGDIETFVSMLVQAGVAI